MATGIEGVVFVLSDIGGGLRDGVHFTGGGVEGVVELKARETRYATLGSVNHLQAFGQATDV